MSVSSTVKVLASLPYQNPENIRTMAEKGIDDEIHVIWQANQLGTCTKSLPYLKQHELHISANKKIKFELAIDNDTPYIQNIGYFFSIISTGKLIQTLRLLLSLWFLLQSI